MRGQQLRRVRLDQFGNVLSSLFCPRKLRRLASEMRAGLSCFVRSGQLTNEWIYVGSPQ